MPFFVHPPRTTRLTRPPPGCSPRPPQRLPLPRSASSSAGCGKRGKAWQRGTSAAEPAACGMARAALSRLLCVRHARATPCLAPACLCAPRCKSDARAPSCACCCARLHICVLHQLPPGLCGPGRKSDAQARPQRISPFALMRSCLLPPPPSSRAAPPRLPRARHAAPAPGGPHGLLQHGTRPRIPHVRGRLSSGPSCPSP